MPKDDEYIILSIEGDAVQVNRRIRILCPAHLERSYALCPVITQHGRCSPFCV
ncbi:MAG: hypothetical protein MRK00_00170 [Nitrosomonas sp.]|nr:hypothetical protein [Nitrosomonas sp.]